MSFRFSSCENTSYRSDNKKQTVEKNRNKAKQNTSQPLFTTVPYLQLCFTSTTLMVGTSTGNRETIHASCRCLCHIDVSFVRSFVRSIVPLYTHTHTVRLQSTDHRPCVAAIVRPLFYRFEIDFSPLRSVQNGSSVSGTLSTLMAAAAATKYQIRPAQFSDQPSELS